MGTKSRIARTGEIDKAIGCNLARLRQERGLSQKDVAAMLGVTFQQVQKYEAGSNRISAASLYVLAQRLEVPLERFYAPTRPEGRQAPGAGREISRMIERVGDRGLRRKIVRVVEILAAP